MSGRSDAETEPMWFWCCGLQGSSACHLRLLIADRATSFYMLLPRQAQSVWWRQPCLWYRNLITVAPRHEENSLQKRRVTSATCWDVEIIEDLLIRLGLFGLEWWNCFQQFCTWSCTCKVWASNGLKRKLAWLTGMSWAFCFLPAMPACLLVRFALSSHLFEHFGTRLHDQCTINAQSMHDQPFRTGATTSSSNYLQGPRYLSLPPPPILCRVQMFVGSLEWNHWRIRPCPKHSKTIGYSAKMIQTFHPNHPTGACHPEILGVQ